MSPVSPISTTANGLEFPFTEADFQTLAGIVYERSGIVLSANKRDMAYARLVRRLRILGLGSFHDYCWLLGSSNGAHEISFLINAMTTNLTKFFREPHHFEHFRSQVLPEIVNGAREANPLVRVWSAGCSSGEEPYSLAMTAIAAQDEIGRKCDLHILATDLDTTMLQKARAAVYPPASLSDVSQSMRERFFEAPANSGAPLSKNVRSLVTFKPMNLIGPWPISGNFDAIFCRNVMIYFDAKAKATLVDRFHPLLKDGGWLYVGHSESLLDRQHQFKLCGRTIYQKINS
ncbi:MAG: protein-glutamate O-methyltransferase CheR [Rhodomicrobium sp.]